MNDKFDKLDIKTNPNLVIALGEYIRTLRLKKSIGLREMADKLNISPAYLSNLELGKHNMTNPLLLKNISKILEIDHLTLYKIVGYTDQDRLEIRNEIWEEIISDISDERIIDIIQKLSNMDSNQIKLVRQYVNLINKV